MFRTVLFAAFCLTSPALADCLPEGQAPFKLVLDSDVTIRVLDQDGDRLHYMQSTPEMDVEMTVQVGAFTLASLRNGEGAVFDWKTPLPGRADLVPGAKFHAEAMLTTPGILPPRPFTTDLEVIGPEEVTVAGCTMQALKVVVVNREAGKNLGEITKWLEPMTLLSLRSEVRQGDDMRAQEVIRME